MVLNAAPIAAFDAHYETALNTNLAITTSDTALLDNDWDPEGDTLTASVVDNPGNGTLSGFNGSAGTFTYSPDTGFSGVDTFTYKVSDGTNDSDVVTVSIAVDGHFGPRTNLEEIAVEGNLLTGDLSMVETLTPGVGLIYSSNTLPQPIVALETYLQSGSDVPDEVTAQLTFDGTAGTAYTYDTTHLSAGDEVRFSLQADATALSSGRYAYSFELTADMMGSLVDHTYDGNVDVVNRGASTHAFGRGWQLAGLDKLVIETNGVVWIQDTGRALWFPEDGSGGYDLAKGDLTFSTLVENLDNSFTLTTKHGIETHFDSSGNITSREDRNGNSVDYTYTSGLVTKITDAVGRDTTLTYTSGRLTSVSDFASRSATLAYDASGRLTSITQPDPDGAGSLNSPVTEFTYDATTHLMTTRTNALDDDTSFTFGSHERLTQVTHPGSSTWKLTSLQTIGLPATTTGNDLAAADPTGTITDERNKVSEFRTDRYGHVTEWVDQLDNETLTERNAAGQVIRLTQADPDGAGSLTSPVTVMGYDESGNLVYVEDPLGSIQTWTHTSTFNQVATATDALGNDTTYTYDVDGNLTKRVDPLDVEGSGWLFEYDSAGRVTEITSPDPDGTMLPAGPLPAAVTDFEYDAYGRLTTMTNPDLTEVEYAYDSADNLITLTDELDNDTTFVYDALNRMTSTTDRESATTSFEYDAIGQRTKVTDALGNVTDTEYHSRGWVTKVTRPDPDGAGALTRPETTYTYDATGNLTQVGEEHFVSLAALRYTYDDAGRRTEKSTGVVGTADTIYEYDALGRLTSTTDPLGAETLFEYDSNGNLTQVMQVTDALMDPPEGPTTQFAYDVANRRVQTIDPRGYATDYTYNAAGQVTKVELPDPDGTGAMGRTFTANIYDYLGRMTSTRNTVLSQRATFEYDIMNHVTKTTEPDPDGAGSLTAPVTNYAYDDLGRMTSVTDPLSRVTSYQYDDEGRVTKVTSPDPDGAGALAPPEVDYAYNDVGQVTSVTDRLERRHINRLRRTWASHIRDAARP